ncbi:MAG: TonB-dependent receptor [Gammaproteobacteria bacterium]|nr:TonB-dependent receptor [Gammaproteobacteria bacterium]
MRSPIILLLLLATPLDQRATASEAIPMEPNISAPEENTSSAPSAEAITTRPFEDTPQLLEEIVVESEPLERTIGHLARPVVVLEDRELREQMAPTIGATLSQQPGINNQSFGPGVGQPVIRGLSGPRVRVMENGIGSNDLSNISPDHANSIEPSQARKVEVLRGPATLLYGSGAIGGVVNVIDDRVPEKRAQQPLSGSLNELYNSALDETSSSLKLEGGEGDIALHLDGFYRNSGNEQIGGAAINEPLARLSNPALTQEPVITNTYGYVANTYAHAQGGTGGLSFVGDSGFVGAAVNYLENNYGVPPIGIPLEPPVRINLTQTKVDLRGGLNQPTDLIESIKLKIGATDYSHIEYTGNPLLGNTWSSSSLETRLELNHQPIGPLKGQWGLQTVNGVTQAIGAEAIIPRTSILNIGLFGVENWVTDPLTYDFGFRIEPQNVTPDSASGFAARQFLPISGSLSGLWTLEDAHHLSFALTESQRGAQAQELYVHGPHDAVQAFEIGNPNLHMESSYNLEGGYTFQQAGYAFQLNLFNNWVNDYIYSQYTGAFDTQGGSASGLPILKVTQGNALFKGFESSALIPVMDNHWGLIDLNLFGDYTRGELINQGNGNVPRMPPLRFGAQLDYALAPWSSYVRVTRGQAQNDNALNETPTAGWVLLNVGIEYQAKTFKEGQLLVYLKGNNLLNENIRNSTSYLKNYAPEPGRGVQLGLELSY